VPRFMLARAGLFFHCAIHRRLLEGAASLPDYIVLPAMGAICDSRGDLRLTMSRKNEDIVWLVHLSSFGLSQLGF
jgi:hypothetical protein